MKRRATETAPASPTNFFGILYAEDFDEPSAADQSANVDEKQPEPPALTQADLDAACAAAVQHARQEWQDDEERQRADRLATIQRALTGIEDICERTILAAAEGTVTTILSIITGILPEFCRDFGPAEVRALLGRLLPTLQSQTKITIRVHPDVVSTVQRDVDALEPDLAAVIAVLPGPIERTDVKVAWENGSMTRDTQQIMQAIQDALSQLGLHRKVEAPTKRIMAYAE